MVKTIIHILLICLIFGLLNLIYQVFNTYPYYDTRPELFFPNLNFPVFIMITFITGLVTERFIMKTNWIWAISLAFLITFGFYHSTKYIEGKNAYLYTHYYQTTPYTDLTSLKEYSEKIGNYVVLGKKLKQEGIKVKSIEGGYTNLGHLANNPISYQKKVYYINEDFYIIFDWDSEEITTKADKSLLITSLYEQTEISNDYELAYLLEIQDNYLEPNYFYGNYFVYTAYEISNHFESGQRTNFYKLIPTNEDTFEFIGD